MYPYVKRACEVGQEAGVLQMAWRGGSGFYRWYGPLRLEIVSREGVVLARVSDNYVRIE